MQSIMLYRYIRQDGGVTISLTQPNCEYTPMYRLSADEGKMLTQDGQNLALCTDVTNTNGWYEVDDAQNPAELTEAEKAAAYDIIMGVSE